MKWNNQRKAAVAVLALAGAAFCVDRFVLGYGPRAASADTVIATINPAPGSTAETGQPTALPEGGVTLTRKVGDLASGHSGSEFPDALRVPADWAPMLVEPLKPDAVHKPEAKETLADPKSFVVSSVFLGASPLTTGARINNKLILLHKSVDGYELVDIIKSNPSIVVLSGPGGELRVPLTIGGTNTNPGADDPATTPQPVHNR